MSLPLLTASPPTAAASAAAARYRDSPLEQVDDRREHNGEVERGQALLDDPLPQGGVERDGEIKKV